jgi:hypothetical protein
MCEFKAVGLQEIRKNSTFAKIWTLESERQFNQNSIYAKVQTSPFSFGRWNSF